MNTEQIKNLTQVADNLFEKYPLKATLHIMSGWYINEKSKTLHKDITITTKDDSAFQDAEFIVHYDEHMAITSCYPKHKTLNIGEQQTFEPALLTEMV